MSEDPSRQDETGPREELSVKPVVGSRFERSVGIGPLQTDWSGRDLLDAIGDLNWAMLVARDPARDGPADRLDWDEDSREAAPPVAVSSFVHASDAAPRAPPVTLGLPREDSPVDSADAGGGLGENSADALDAAALPSQSNSIDFDRASGSGLHAAPNTPGSDVSGSDHVERDGVPTGERRAADVASSPTLQQLSSEERLDVTTATLAGEGRRHSIPVPGESVEAMTWHAETPPGFKAPNVTSGARVFSGSSSIGEQRPRTDAAVPDRLPLLSPVDHAAASVPAPSRGASGPDHAAHAADTGGSAPSFEQDETSATSRTPPNASADRGGLVAPSTRALVTDHAPASPRSSGVSHPALSPSHVRSITATPDSPSDVSRAATARIVPMDAPLSHRASSAPAAGAPPSRQDLASWMPPHGVRQHPDWQAYVPPGRTATSAALVEDAAPSQPSPVANTSVDATRTALQDVVPLPMQDAAATAVSSRTSDERETAAPADATPLSAANPIDRAPLVGADMIGIDPVTRDRAPIRPSPSWRREDAPIRISIGRISVEEPEVPTPLRVGRARPTLTLSDYLKRRGAP